ncbi:MAG TPA: nuclear transport factor 2 family protein [Solirubrobacteraceae bacterium]|jgi:ketosteroid isomerase-like protein|nr:nuclear transport factor 2 family protein [Solirubrobacteraceae bacterium]
MSSNDHVQLARRTYAAYESGDRNALEAILADDFTFYSPLDVGIDRARYFERCWPNSALIESFQFRRLIEVGDEVLVTYESTKTDGRRFRNTEVLSFADGKATRAEVYFGWDL